MYTCGERSDPLPGIKKILAYLKPREYYVWYADRSQNAKGGNDPIRITKL